MKRRDLKNGARRLVGDGKKETEDTNNTEAETEAATQADGKPKRRKGTVRIVIIAGVPGYYLEGICKQLNVSQRTARQYVKSGRLKAQKVGGRIFCAEENLQAFLRGERATDQTV